MSGVFGVVSTERCVNTLFFGTDYHSHLGTEFGGIALGTKELKRVIHSINYSQFKSKFYDQIKSLSGTKGIGVVSSLDEQPVYLRSKLGAFCLVTTGFIENAEDLAKSLLNHGHSFAEVSRREVNQTELAAKLITTGETIVDGIERLFRAIEGSCSLLLLNEEGIYAARDRCGYNHLAIGRGKSGWAVASETCAFPNTGFETVKHLLPGEIVLLSEDGMNGLAPGTTEAQFCSFLWIYTGFPASSYEGINTETARERCGRALARHDGDLKADLVAGVPDSGVAHAIGYAAESRLPYRRPLVKYTPGYGRSYTPPSQETRDLVATMKLIPVKEIIDGNRIVLCEDSIVRGTQLKNYTVTKLMKAGAKEVHVRPACPPLMFPCRFNLSTRSTDELVARKAIRALEGKEPEDISPYLDARTNKYQAMVDWIAKDIGVTTLRYQHVDDMVEAIGLPREKLCLHCWTGECPDGGPGKRCCTPDGQCSSCPTK